MTVAGVVSESDHDTAVAFSFSKAKEEFHFQNPDGTLSDPVIAEIDAKAGGFDITDVSHDALAAFAHDHGHLLLV